MFPNPGGNSTCLFINAEGTQLASYLFIPNLHLRTVPTVLPRLAFRSHSLFIRLWERDGGTA